MSFCDTGLNIEAGLAVNIFAPRQIVLVWFQRVLDYACL